MNSRLAIYAEASPSIGGGHVQRCLALAEALLRASRSVTFVTTPVSVETVPALSQRPDISFVEASTPEATAMRLAAEGIGTVVLDRYGDTVLLEKALRSGAKLAVIEDHPNRVHYCDLLVDSTFGRRSSDYAGWVPTGCRVGTGSHFAMLREEFAQHRDLAIRRRRREGAARIFVCFGATDPTALTVPVLEHLIAALPEAEINVALGPAAVGLDAARAFAARTARVSLHIAPASMSALMAEADLAIGAAGTMSWERCCLALPSVAVPIVENQSLIADELRLTGAATIVMDTGPGLAREIAEAARHLSGDEALRQRMAASAAALCDGRGAVRVVGLIDGLGREEGFDPGEMAVRTARRADSSLIWAWRNDPASRSASRGSDPIPWPDHDAWYRRAMEDENRLFLVGEVGVSAPDPVGMVRFDRQSTAARLSIVIAPAFRGRRAGRELLRRSLAMVASRWRVDRIAAEVRATNAASLSLFRSCGFRETGLLNSFVQFELATGRTDA